MVYCTPSHSLLPPLSQLSVQCSAILLLDHVRTVYCVYSKASFLLRSLGWRNPSPQYFFIINFCFGAQTNFNHWTIKQLWSERLLCQPTVIMRVLRMNGLRITDFFGAFKMRKFFPLHPPTCFPLWDLFWITSLSVCPHSTSSACCVEIAVQCYTMLGQGLKKWVFPPFPPHSPFLKLMASCCHARPVQSE